MNIADEIKEELYLLSGRADTGNIDAILMFYAWLFVRANCELQKYNRTGQQVIEEILQELFNPNNDYCILDERTPPCIEGLHWLLIEFCVRCTIYLLGARKKAIQDMEKLE